MTESIREKNRDWKLYLIFAILFASATVFIPNMRIYYDILGIIFFDLVLIRRRIRLDWGDAAIVLATAVFKACDNPDPGAVIMDTLKIFALFQIARYIADPWDREGTLQDQEGTLQDQDSSDWVSAVVLIMALIFFVKGLMNYSYVLKDSSMFGQGYWPEWKPQWSLQDLYAERLSHEDHQFYIILMGSILPFFVMKIRKSKILGSAGILLSLSALWMGTLTKGGLTLICALFAFLAVFIVYVLEKGLYRNLRFWIIIMAAVDAVTAFLLAARQNLFGLGYWYRDYIWSAADSGFYKFRFTLMGQALELLPKYPFGGFNYKLVIPNVATEYSAYNSWLDIGVDEGIIPLILYVAFLIITILALAYVCRNSSGIGKYMITAAYTGMTMYHMLEPGFSNYIYWNVEIFLGGLVCGLYANISGKKGIEISFDKAAKWIEGLTDGRKPQKQ